MTEKLTMAGSRLPDFAAEIRVLVGEGAKRPPVNDWHPERVGEIDIRIAKDGVWFYQNNPMERESIVKLFSGILRKDENEYFLVTPVEKMKVVVEDVPFVVCMMDVEGEGKDQKIYFSTNVGDAFLLSEAHALTVKYNAKKEPSPYVLVRDKLHALISRQVYYELAEFAVDASDGEEGEVFGVWSDGGFFSL